LVSLTDFGVAGVIRVLAVWFLTVAVYSFVVAVVGRLVTNALVIDGFVVAVVGLVV